MIEELKRRKREQYPIFAAEFVYEMIEILLPLYKRFHKGQNRDLTEEAEALVMLSKDMLERCKIEAKQEDREGGVPQMRAEMRLAIQHNQLLAQAKEEDRMSVD